MRPFIRLVPAAGVYHMRHPITGDLTVSHRSNKAGWNIISASPRRGCTFSLTLCAFLGSTCRNKSSESNSFCSSLLLLYLDLLRAWLVQGRTRNKTHFIAYLIPHSCLVHSGIFFGAAMQTSRLMVRQQNVSLTLCHIRIHLALANT